LSCRGDISHSTLWRQGRSATLAAVVWRAMQLDRLPAEARCGSSGQRNALTHIRRELWTAMVPGTRANAR
jgi:hypothetical protein